MPVISDLIFLRHSLPVVDLATPAREWHLSKEGQRRCRLLAARLGGYQPHRIVSSLEPKAMETAQIVAETLDMTYDCFEGLHEHLRSRIEHSSQEVFEASVRAFFEHPDRLVYGDETADQAHARISQAVKATQEQYPGPSPLVIVSHGTVISIFVARIYNIDPFPFWKSLTLPCMILLSAQAPKIVPYDASHTYPFIPEP